jgi:hypothetical protein
MFESVESLFAENAIKQESAVEGGKPGFRARVRLQGNRQRR